MMGRQAAQSVTALRPSLSLSLGLSLLLLLGHTTGAAQTTATDPPAHPGSLYARPLTFEQLHSRLRAGVLECDRSRFALRTVVQARNQRHAGQDWLAMQLSGTTSADTLLGPLERPATPEQLRSVVGQERCSPP
jgi:hypothetical protein